MASRTSIRKIGEFGLIKLIERTLFSPKKQSGLVIGIGDDAAVFETARGKWNVITVDAMAEGVHFDLRYTDFQKLGWKAMTSNLSDLAAMGAEPKWALINLTIPNKIKVEDIRQLYRGISGCGKKFHIRVIGGNITRARKEFVISITALGEIRKNEILTRRGAKIGDVIAVTGDLGASHAGLRILQNKLRPSINGRAVRKHLTPEPRTNWIQLLKRSGVKIHTCIDISDGLTSDLKHVCDASRVGAEIYWEWLPIHSITKKVSASLGEGVTGYALNGGEEYELLMTLESSQFEKAKKILGKRITAIGRINASRQITLIRNEKRTTLLAKGFKHF
jgi:thiamine-monophosphate kinase